MEIVINTKYNINQEVYIVWNANTAYNAFIKGEDVSSWIIKTNVLSILNVKIRNNKHIITYKLDNVFYDIEEERVFSSKENANDFLMQEIQKNLERQLEDLEKQSTKSLDAIYNNFKSELEQHSQEKVQITTEIQNLKKLRDNLTRLNINKLTQF